ncbi:MAG: SDR family oxidoreductase [Syntrophaceae bacterium]|nr:SDR family oxidoreductase [Syntrophaceae bacterium]
MKDFKNKLVYITGGSSGIGLATAKLMAAEGASVVIFGRRQQLLDEAIKQVQICGVYSGQKFAGRSMDVSKRDSVETVLSSVLAEFGVPDVLVNCAGRAYPRYFENINYQQFDDTMKTNFYGIWNTCSILVPYMKTKGGTIVNVASMAGFLGVFGYCDYAASKFAVVGFSETLKSELKKYNISVQVLCPPDTDTQGFAAENVTKPMETRVISASAKLMSSDRVAQELVSGIRKNTFMIIPGFEGKITYFLKRYMPFVIDMFMNAAINKAQKK